jgi:transglutaminase-like putative cysteine protease
MQRPCKVNLSFGKNEGKYCVFSLPQTNEYQEIKEFSINPKSERLVFDEWGNTIGIFSDNTEIDFLYSPKHLKKTIDEKWTISDYKINKNVHFYLKTSRFVNGKDKMVKNLVQSLVKNEWNVSSLTKIFYDFTLTYLTYGKPTEGLYPYSQAIQEKITDCGGYSTFLLSLFQSVGIPGRLVAGFVLNKDFSKKILSAFQVSRFTFHDFSMHAWPEILLPDSTWFPMDPSVEWKRTHGKSKRQGGFGDISNDRLVVSFGQDFKMRVNNEIYTIDLLQLPVYL